jgi:hypothetical protein
MADDVDSTDPLHHAYRILNAWEGTPLVMLFFLGLSVPFVLIVGRPPWYMLFATLTAAATYLFVALRDLEREEPIGVLNDENR